MSPTVSMRSRSVWRNWGGAHGSAITSCTGTGGDGGPRPKEYLLSQGNGGI
jgi:hypothetical protein